MRVTVNDDSIHCYVNYRFKASCIKVYMDEDFKHSEQVFGVSTISLFSSSFSG